MGPDGLTLAIGHSTSAGEKVQGWAKGASVFKTLNTTGFGNMADPVFHGVGAAMFVAGDDAANKPKVVELVGALGFEVVDAGPLRNAHLLEAHAMLWIDLALNRGLGRDFAFALLRLNGSEGLLNFRRVHGFSRIANCANRVSRHGALAVSGSL